MEKMGPWLYPVNLDLFYLLGQYLLSYNDRIPSFAKFLFSEQEVLLFYRIEQKADRPNRLISWEKANWDDRILGRDFHPENTTN